MWQRLAIGGPMGLTWERTGISVRQHERFEHARRHAGLDLIDAKNKDLAWRLYLVRKIVKVDKDWKKADQDFRKGFESYRHRRNKLSKRKKSGRTRSQSQNKCNERSEGWTLQRSRDGGGNESWTKLAVLQ
jgi:hypothetical protein